MLSNDDFRLLMLGKITSAEYVKRLREAVMRQREAFRDAR